MNKNANFTRFELNWNSIFIFVTEFIIINFLLLHFDIILVEGLSIKLPDGSRDKYLYDYKNFELR